MEILVLLVLSVTVVEKFVLVSHKYFSLSNDSSSFFVDMFFRQW